MLGVCCGELSNVSICYVLVSPFSFVQRVKSEALEIAKLLEWLR